MIQREWQYTHIYVKLLFIGWANNGIHSELYLTLMKRDKYINRTWGNYGHVTILQMSTRWGAASTLYEIAVPLPAGTSSGTCARHGTTLVSIHFFKVTFSLLRKCQISLQCTNVFDSELFRSMNVNYRVQFCGTLLLLFLAMKIIALKSFRWEEKNFYNHSMNIVFWVGIWWVRDLNEKFWRETT